MILLALAIIASTPQTFAADLKAAKPGDTLAMSGTFGALSIASRQWSPPVTLDATAATIDNLRITSATGLTVKGGHYVQSPLAANAWLGGIYIAKSDTVSVDGVDVLGHRDGPGITARESRNITVTNSRVDRVVVAIALQRIEGGQIAGNTVLGFSDGIDLWASHNVVIEGNQCAGGMVIGKKHPDCVQGVSFVGEQPTSDIIIRGNIASGPTQGFSLFDHGTGGYDRILIENNIAALSYPQAIALYAARNSIVRNNIVRTLSGSQFRASINVVGAVAGTQCGNVVEAGAGKPGIVDKGCVP